MSFEMKKGFYFCKFYFDEYNHVYNLSVDVNGKKSIKFNKNAFLKFNFDKQMFYKHKQYNDTFHKKLHILMQEVDKFSENIIKEFNIEKFYKLNIGIVFLFKQELINKNKNVVRSFFYIDDRIFFVDSHIHTYYKLFLSLNKIINSKKHENKK